MAGSWRRQPRTVADVAEDIGADPEELERLFDELLERDPDVVDADEDDEDEDDVWSPGWSPSPYRESFFFLAVFMQALPDADLPERVRRAAACERDRLGSPWEERAQGEYDELPLADIVEKHGLELDRLLGVFASYGSLHLACPSCGSIRLMQVQEDSIDGELYRHHIQTIFRDASDGELWVEFIPVEFDGPDEDPSEYGIECQDCKWLDTRSELVVAAAARPPG